MYRNYKCIMCAYCVGNHSFFRCPSSGGSSGQTNDVHTDYASSERDTRPPEFNPIQTILPTASFFSSYGDITSTQYAYEGSVNPGYMEQPPAHVIDYWFHRLGLSLDAPVAASPSDLPNVSSSLSVPDEISLSVSPTLVMLYHIHYCLPCAHTLRRRS